MQISIALDDCIRDVSSIKKQLSLSEEEWSEYKSLSIPDIKAEDKINLWYDQCCNIHIIAESNSDNKKWLKDHYIPYNYISKDKYSINSDIIIDSNFNRCIDMSKFCKKTFYLNISNINDYNINESENILIVKSWNSIGLFV